MITSNLKYLGMVGLGLVIAGIVGASSTSQISRPHNSSKPSSQITVIANIPVGRSPMGLAANPAGARLYVTNEYGNNSSDYFPAYGTVSIIDTASNTVVATVDVGEIPVGAVVNRSGTRLYVVNQCRTNAITCSPPGDGTVSVIDTASRAVIATVAVGSGPHGIAISPAGTRLYTANQFNDTVSVIDTTSQAVLAAVPVGTGPAGIAVNPTGTHLYVTNIYSRDVSVIDTAQNIVVATIDTESGPVGIAVNPAGTRLYVANQFSNTVSIIDTTSNTVIATVPVGRFPAGVAVNPAGTRLYVTNVLSDAVSVIDTASNTVVDTVSVEDEPQGIAVNPAGTRVYVANLGSNTISVIDTADNTVVATIGAGKNLAASSRDVSSAFHTPFTPSLACSNSL